MSEAASDADIARCIADGAGNAASCEVELGRPFLSRARFFGLAAAVHRADEPFSTAGK